MLTDFTPDRPMDSFDAFVDFADRHFAAGITEIVLHTPAPDTQFAVDPRRYERIATEALKTLM